jgi:flagellar biosynthesis/type III secretory pathway protein FliH
MSELIKALSKIYRHGISEEGRKEALEELADVTITCAQMMMLMQITDEELLEQMNYKLLRLANKMEFDYQEKK